MNTKEVLQSQKQHSNICHPVLRISVQLTVIGLYFVFGATAPSGPGPPHSRGFYITHNDAPQSVELLWTRDQLVAETSTWQHTTLTPDRQTCLSGIRTRNLIKRAAADLAVTGTGIIGHYFGGGGGGGGEGG